MAYDRNGRGNSEREVTFNIIEQLGVVAEYKSGWRKELNIIEWNNGAPKYDLRDWDKEHEHMSKGVTLVKDEAKELCRLLMESFEQDVSDTVPAKSDRMI